MVKRTRRAVLSDLYYHAVGITRYASILDGGTRDRPAYEQLLKTEMCKLARTWAEYQEQSKDNADEFERQE